MIYKIRVILNSDDDVFRDLAISDQSSLEDLHNAILQAFGFLGNEMASFYTCDDEWEQDEEIVLYPMEESQNVSRRMGDVELSDILTEASPKLLYVYDFLRMYTFYVELADTAEPEEGKNYPLLLFSFGDIPEHTPDLMFESEDEEDGDDFPEDYREDDFDVEDMDDDLRDDSIDNFDDFGFGNNYN